MFGYRKDELPKLSKGIQLKGIEKPICVYEISKKIKYIALKKAYGITQQNVIDPECKIAF
jgi:hypothetical protein